MESTGRKNAAGAWLRGELFQRIASAGMIWMAVVGFTLGFMIRGLSLFDGAAGDSVSWAMVGVMVLAFGVFWAYCLRVDATWGRGLKAERQIGDFIEHAVAQRGCAFAHDVKEALGGQGNVDHVVMTPAGIWVVETKARRVSKRRFRRALRQVAENVRRVRQRLDTSLPIRGALVIADRTDDSLESDHDWSGEPIKVFGAKRFWSVLRVEGEQPRSIGRSPETARVERLVWDLGSTRYLDS